MPDLLERLRAALAGRYAVESEIGRGGMAVVFLADDLRHGRRVAIKVLHPELSATLAAERFLNEIQIVAGLTHPHILTLHESGEADGLLYYVMPYLPGESLRQRLEREGQLPVEEAVRIAVEVADGLDFAHRQGVVHRDVKPGNILISDKHAVITDFGIARAISMARAKRMTGTGLGVGTPLYASPEQATGAETLDGRTDIYSLGCVLYEMLAGEVPLMGPTPQAMQARRLAETPSPLHAWRESVPPLLDQVIAKALARLPADRWETAEAFGQALLTATMDATPIARLELATTPGQETSAARPRARASKRSTSRWVWLAAAVGVALIGAWLMYGPMAVSTRPEARVPGPEWVAATETAIDFEESLVQHVSSVGVAPFAISPDGNELAYCSHDASGDVHRLRLAHLSAAERTHRVLATGTSCDWVRWSTTGEHVLFRGTTQGSFGIFAVSRQGGSARPLIQCPSFDEAGNFVFDSRWARHSPDGSRLAFSVTPSSYIRILPAGTCDLARSDSIPVAGEYIGLLLHSWSPSGDRLLVETAHAGGLSTLWTVGVQEHLQLPIVTQAGFMSPSFWSADGRAVYYGQEDPSGQRRVMRVRIARDGEAKGDPEALEYFEDRPVSWFSLSSDARTAVVGRESHRFRIVRVMEGEQGADTSATLAPVTDTIAGKGYFDVSRDGEWIAYVESSDEGSDLFTIGATGGGSRRVTRSGDLSSAERPAWSPDDRFLAYVARFRDTLRIWMVSADGRTTGQIRDVIPNFEVARLSWEGSELFFTGQGYRSEVLRDLQFEHGHWSGLEWRPTREGVPEPRTFVVDAEHELFTDAASEWDCYASLGSPDGKSAVSECQLRGSRGIYWCLITRRDMSITPLESWSRDGRGPLGWAEDSRSVYWRTGDEVYRWPIDGGDRELVLRLPPGLESCQVRPGVEPVELVCTEREFTTRLFLVENVDPQVN